MAVVAILADIMAIVQLLAQMHIIVHVNQVLPVKIAKQVKFSY